MKKLLMMVIAMTLITGSAFAGTLTWGSMDGEGFASAFFDNTPLPFSGTAYLFLLNGVNQVSWTGSAWNIPDGTWFLASSGAGTLEATAGTWGYGAENVLDARMSATFNYQAVLVTATGHAALGDVTGGFWASTGPTLITGYDPGIGGADATGGLYWQQGSLAPGNWAPVPEPTSFALLAIGAAVIGLRRRIRK